MSVPSFFVMAVYYFMLCMCLHLCNDLPFRLSFLKISNNASLNMQEELWVSVRKIPKGGLGSTSWTAYLLYFNDPAK